MGPGLILPVDRAVLLKSARGNHGPGARHLVFTSQCACKSEPLSDWRRLRIEHVLGSQHVAFVDKRSHREMLDQDSALNQADG